MPTTQTLPVTAPVAVSTVLVPSSNPFDTLRAKWSARKATRRATDDMYAAADVVLGSRLDAMDRSGA